MTRILLFCLLFAGFNLCQCTSGIKPRKPGTQIPFQAIDCSDPALPGFIKSICRSRELQTDQQNIIDPPEKLAEHDPIRLLRNPYLRNTPLRVFVILFGVISLILLLGALVIYVVHALKSRAPAGLRKYNFLAEAFYDSHISFKTKLFTLFYVVTLLVFVFVFITLSDRKTLGGTGGCWFIAGFNYYLFTTLCTLSIILLFRVMVEFGKWKPGFYTVVNFFGGEIRLVQPIVLAFVIPAVLLLIFGMSYNGFLKRSDDFCWIRSDHRFPSIGVPVIMHIISLFLLIPILARRFPHLGVCRLINKLFMEEQDLESYSIEEGRPKAAITDVHTHLPPSNCTYWWHFVPQVFLGLVAIFEAVSYTHNHTTFWHVMFSLLITLKVPVLFALRLWHWKRHRAQHVIHAEDDIGSGVTVRKTLTDTAQLPDNFAPGIHVPDLDTISEHLEPADDVVQVLQRDQELQSLHSKISASRSRSRKSSASISCVSEGSVNHASTTDAAEHHATYDNVPVDTGSECSHVSHASRESHCESEEYSIHELALTEELQEIPFEVEAPPAHGILKKSHTIDDSEGEADIVNRVLERQDTLDVPPKPPRGITPQGSLTQDTSTTPPPTPMVGVGEGALPWWSKTLQSESSENAALEHLHEALSGEYSDEDNAGRHRESQTVALEFSSDSDVNVENVVTMERDHDLEYIPLGEGVVEGRDEFYTPRSTSTESLCNSSDGNVSELRQLEHKTDVHHTVIENEVITHFEGIANATINVHVQKFPVNGSASLSFEPIFTELPFDTASVTTAASLAPSLTSLVEIGQTPATETAAIGRGVDVSSIGHGARVEDSSLATAWKSSVIEQYGHETHGLQEQLHHDYGSTKASDVVSDKHLVAEKTQSHVQHEHHLETVTHIQHHYHETHSATEKSNSDHGIVETNVEHHITSPVPLATTEAELDHALRSPLSSRTTSTTSASQSSTGDSSTETEEANIHHLAEQKSRHVEHEVYGLHHQHSTTLPLAKSIKTVETTVEFDIGRQRSVDSATSKSSTESSKSGSVTSSSVTPTRSVESLSGEDIGDNVKSVEHGQSIDHHHDAVHEAITHSISQSLLAADTTTRVETVETNVEIGLQETESAAIVLSAAPVELPNAYASDSETSIVAQSVPHGEERHHDKFAEHRHHEDHLTGLDQSEIRSSVEPDSIQHENVYPALSPSKHESVDLESPEEIESAAIVLSAAPVVLPNAYASDSEASIVVQSAEPHEEKAHHDSIAEHRERSEIRSSVATDSIHHHESVYPALDSSRHESGYPALGPANEEFRTVDVNHFSHSDATLPHSAQYPKLNNEFGASETSFTTHSYGTNFSSSITPNYPDLHGNLDHGVRSISSRPPLHNTFTTQFTSAHASTYSESKSSTIPRPTPRRSLYYDLP